MLRPLSILVLFVTLISGLYFQMHGYQAGVNAPELLTSLTFRRPNFTAKVSSHELAITTRRGVDWRW